MKNSLQNGHCPHCPLAVHASSLLPIWESARYSEVEALILCLCNCLSAVCGDVLWDFMQQIKDAGVLISFLRVIHKRLVGIPTRCVICARDCWLKIRLCLLWNFMQSRRSGITLRFSDNGCMSAIYDCYNIISLNSVSIKWDDDNWDANEARVKGGSSSIIIMVVRVWWSNYGQ